MNRRFAKYYTTLTLSIFNPNQPVTRKLCSIILFPLMSNNVENKTLVSCKYIVNTVIPSHYRATNRRFQSY